MTPQIIQSNNIIPRARLCPQCHTLTTDMGCPECEQNTNLTYVQTKHLPLEIEITLLIDGLGQAWLSIDKPSGRILLNVEEQDFLPYIR